MKRLRPFWRYYGGKYRAAPRYPAPRYRTIIEPFAGAAGYSMLYPDRDVVLIDKYPVITGIWRYLIRTPAAEILRIPPVEAIADLPAWVPEEARWLVGFLLNSATTAPCTVLSSGARRCNAESGRGTYGWTEYRRGIVASQVEFIRHWRVVDGAYDAAPNVEATWFVDPPYQSAGKLYICSSTEIDFPALGAWCKARKGQVVVCENAGATWLPFRPLFAMHTSITGRDSVEAIWTNDVSSVADRVRAWVKSRAA